MDPKNIEQLLKESTKDILSDESLSKLTQAINEKADSIAKEKYKLQVEAALAKQDAEFSDKLKTLLEEIDTNHTEKMEKLVEAIENKHCGQLKQLVKKYRTDFIKESKNFKESLVNKMDKFFDLVVEKNIPKQQLNEAVENIRYKKLVQEIGKMISLSNIQENNLVREGLQDAKERMDQLNEQVEKLKKHNQKLLTEQKQIRVNKLLTEKCAGLPRVKRDYVFKMLSNKDESFITENFDYTLELFDDDDARKTNVITESAKRKSKVITEDIDRPETVIEEDVRDNDDETNIYMEELSKI